MPFFENLRPETAILLVGGRGARLGALTEQTPKPLIPVAGRPFVQHVLDYLIEQGITRVVMATGYQGNQFEIVLGTNYRGLTIGYSRELSPLGTGGAIAQALMGLDCRTAFVLNGDTYFDVDLRELAQFQATKQAALCMALYSVTDSTRYGRVAVNDGTIVEMFEKGVAGPGLINGGIYLVDRAKFLQEKPNGSFSFERDLLPTWVAQGEVAGTVSEGYFIDIGIPADLQRAQREMI